MSEDSFRERARNIIADDVGAEPSEITDDMELFDSGEVDSEILVEIQALLEKMLGRELAIGEMTRTDVSTLDDMVRFFESRTT